MSDPRGRFVTLTREIVAHLAHCLPQRVSYYGLNIGDEFSSFQKQNRL